MMKQQIKNINIIPALFEKYVNDGVLLKCYLSADIIQKRIFDVNYIMHIKNPKYLLIGIKTGVGIKEIMVTDANDYEVLFKEKWSEILC